MKVVRIDWSRVWILAWGFYFENRYFGWNRFPESDAEMICDLILLLMMTLCVSVESKS